ncbi:MAG TPA: hypothetical protein GX530_09100 [Corynebacteriales bacterium]|nr:hypothetical protein [Mycobacteriales bacterium]
MEGYSEFGNNEITLSGTLSGAYDGVDISGGATENWTISGNELDGSNVGTSSSGFRLRNSLPSGAVLNLSGNRITGWTKGFYSDTLATGTTVELRRNWIYDNTSYGIHCHTGSQCIGVKALGPTGDSIAGQVQICTRGQAVHQSKTGTIAAHIISVQLIVADRPVFGSTSGDLYSIVSAAASAAQTDFVAFKLRSPFHIG